jgi:predicted nucleic acid-binding protein
MRRLLDTSVLISYWRSRTRDGLSGKSLDDARNWANGLIGNYGSRLISTPVVVEFLCGVRSERERDLALAYLGAFELIDKGEILKEDWDEAVRFAQRVPHDGKPRQLGDCLMKAIARRFNLAPYSLDKRFR